MAQDMYELAIRHGGMELIPEALCQDHRTRRAVVWTVLVDRLLSDRPRTTAEVATRLGLRIDQAQAADAVLEDAGLIVRALIGLAKH